MLINNWYENYFHNYMNNLKYMNDYQNFNNKCNTMRSLLCVKVIHKVLIIVFFEIYYMNVCRLLCFTTMHEHFNYKLQTLIYVYSEFV